MKLVKGHSDASAEYKALCIIVTIQHFTDKIVGKDSFETNPFLECCLCTYTPVVSLVRNAVFLQKNSVNSA